MGLCRSIDNPHEAAKSKAGQMLWACDAPSCTNRRVPWSQSWEWFGSYRDWEDDHFGVFAVCCAACKNEFDAMMNRKQEKPRNG